MGSACGVLGWALPVFYFDGICRRCTFMGCTRMLHRWALPEVYVTALFPCSTLIGSTRSLYRSAVPAFYSVGIPANQNAGICLHYSLLGSAGGLHRWDLPALCFVWLCPRFLLLGSA